MINNSILNPISFFNLANNDLPNDRNTLFNDRRHGNSKTSKYYQPFNNGETIYLQFYSDSSEVPVLKAYNALTLVEIETLSVSLVHSIVGVVTRHFFNALVAFTANYQNQFVYFVLTQSSDTLTSNNIKVYSLTNEISKGFIKKIQYKNGDAYNSSLKSYFVDWPYVGSTDGYLHFWIHAQDKSLADTDKTELLDGSQSKRIVSSTIYAGRTLKTGEISDYMYRKLECASSLDSFLVNGIQYVKDGAVEVTDFGTSNLVQCNIKLTEKDAIGINVDNLGLTASTTTSDMIVTVKNDNVFDDFTVTKPANYDLHYIKIRHFVRYGNTATVTCGWSAGSTELIDSVNGVIEDDGTIRSFPIHNNNQDDNGEATLYFGVSGTGINLQIVCAFELIETT